MAPDEIRGARCLGRDRARAEPIGHDLDRGDLYAVPGDSSPVREGFAQVRNSRCGTPHVAGARLLRLHQARGPTGRGPTDVRAPSRRAGVDFSRLSGALLDTPAAR